MLGISGLFWSHTTTCTEGSSTSLSPAKPGFLALDLVPVLPSPYSYLCHCLVLLLRNKTMKFFFLVLIEPSLIPLPLSYIFVRVSPIPSSFLFSFLLSFLPLFLPFSSILFFFFLAIMATYFLQKITI